MQLSQRLDKFIFHRLAYFQIQSFINVSFCIVCPIKNLKDVMHVLLIHFHTTFSKHISTFQWIQHYCQASQSKLFFTLKYLKAKRKEHDHDWIECQVSAQNCIKSYSTFCLPFQNKTLACRQQSYVFLTIMLLKKILMGFLKSFLFVSNWLYMLLHLERISTTL